MTITVVLKFGEDSYISVKSSSQTHSRDANGAR